ncbi:MAG: ArsA family ATPase [Actinomycetota bacterium]|nr:ArsA family ATPase [Actinomycetota bacterium]
MSPSPRILLFTGKGGVGKTTVAAATALATAQRGLRTIVLSTDPAHSLADAFALPLGADPTPVTHGLWGQQLDAQKRLEEAWGELQVYVTEVLGWVGLDEVTAEELSVVPGLDEVFALSDIKDHATSGEWDVVVVDCAPTAETIRLLSLPEILSWYLSHIFPVSRAVAGAIRPVVSRISNLPIPSEEVFQATLRFALRLDGVRDVLADGTRTTARLVVNPERMVVAEARRTYTYLSLFGYRTDAVVVNRLLPEAVSDPWFHQWRAAHAEHLASIAAAFAPLPLLRAELAAEEVVGLDRLRRFADKLYAETDPVAILHEGEPMRVVAGANGERVLSLQLPLAEPGDLDVGRRDSELLVRVGSWRRAMMLPDSLSRRPTAGARLVGDRLEITFGTPGGGER